MARAGDVIDNPVTGERITFLKTAADTGGALLQLHVTVAPGGAIAAEHIHGRQEERFRVLAGTAGFRVGTGAAQREERLGRGRTLVVLAGKPHYWRNAGDDELEMVVEFTPALNTEEFFETMWGLARDGRLLPGGRAPLLQGALLGLEHEMWLPHPPVPVQRMLSKALAPLARLRGYRVRYPRYSLAGASALASTLAFEPVG